MISTSHLRDVRLGLWRLSADTVLRPETEGFRQGSVRRKSILIDGKILNKRTGASAFILGSKAATTQIIQSIGKFDGTDFAVWQRTLHAMVNLVHPEISEILDVQMRPEPRYRTTRGCGRPAARGVTTSISALPGALGGKKLTSGGKGE